MKFINQNNKKAWIICGVSFAAALISFAFLPNTIPTHFNASGIADSFSNKTAIFLFPLIQIIIIFLSGRKKIKYCLTHSKTFLTDTQYNWMIAGLSLLLLLFEFGTIYYCFFI